MTKHGEPGSKNYTKANRSAVLITSKESLQHTIIRTKKRLAKSCPASRLRTKNYAWICELARSISNRRRKFSALAGSRSSGRVSGPILMATRIDPG